MAEKFGRYWLHKKIGAGGMAEIFRATIGPDPHTYAFDLALKRMHARLEEDASQVDMFLTEADVAKFLRHPNLVRVYESGLNDGRAYIAMEYVRGTDLARLIARLAKRNLRFPSDVAVFITLQLLRALDYVHRAVSPGGVPMELVHRDVTPSNVFLTRAGEVKLGDFGVARVSFLEPHDSAGTLVGKAAYMPPEVLAGATVDQQVDLWGVAVILYEMLTARAVYEGVSETDLIAGIAAPVFVPVHRACPGIDLKLARIVNGALGRRKRRPADALSFYRQLKLYLRDEGIVVDGHALARFFGEITETLHTRPEPSGAPDESSFTLPEYRVPLGLSPTQRFERAERRRAWWRPLLLAFSMLALTAAVFAVYRLHIAPSPELAGPASVTSKNGRASGTQDSAANADADTDATGFELFTALDDTSASSDASADSDPSSNMSSKPDRLERIKDPAARFKALMHRGRVQLKRDRLESALVAFEAASALKPDAVAPRLGQANVLVALERHPEAEAQINIVLERKPRNGPAYLLLGEVMRARGEQEQARWAFEKCIKVAPDSKAAKSARKALGEL
jgi:serine/threonine-protein kinase